MARAPKSANIVAAGLPQKTFVLDNGANTIKAGYAPAQDIADEECLQSCNVIPNCIVRSRERKTYVAAASSAITQWSEAVFRRPIENGQLVNWEAEREIWDSSFFDESTAPSQTLIRDPADTTLLLTEAPNTMPALQKNADEIIMEEWGFGGYMRVDGPSLNAYNDLHPLFEDAAAPKAQSDLADLPIECLLVIDSGYSYTTITPCFQGHPIQRAVRRLDFGGKHMTNLLKEIVSVRHFDLHQDTKIVNDIKEDVAFISKDIRLDLEKTWKGNRERKILAPQNSMHTTQDDQFSDVRVDYVLPDAVNLVRGYARPYDPSVEAAKKRKLAASRPDSGEIVMTLGNERFTIPEILFSPGDIGSKQPGLADCVAQSLSKLPPLVQATMVANVILVGGNAKIPGFAERLQNELRAKIRIEWPVHVRTMGDPLTSTWLGGARLASKHREILQKYAVTKEQYNEHGSAWVARHFTTAQK